MNQSHRTLVQTFSGWPIRRGPHKTIRKWDGKGGVGSLDSVFFPWEPTCSPRGKFHLVRPVLQIPHAWCWLNATRLRRANPEQRGKLEAVQARSASQRGGKIPGPSSHYSEKRVPQKPPHAAPGTGSLDSAKGSPPTAQVPTEARASLQFREGERGGPRRGSPAPARADCRIRPASSWTLAALLPSAPQALAKAPVSGRAARLAWVASGTGPGATESAPSTPRAAAAEVTCVRAGACLNRFPGDPRVCRGSATAAEGGAAARRGGGLSPPRGLELRAPRGAWIWVLWARRR